MATVLAATSYSRGGFNLCLAGSVRNFMVPGGSLFRLEPGTISSYRAMDLCFIFRDLSDYPVP